MVLQHCGDELNDIAARPFQRPNFPHITPVEIDSDLKGFGCDRCTSASLKYCNIVLRNRRGVAQRTVINTIKDPVGN